jgi:hypothetical protein
VLPDGEEASHDELLKPLHQRRHGLSVAAHELDHLVRQLEAGALELHVLRRRDVEDETEV